MEQAKNTIPLLENHQQLEELANLVRETNISSFLNGWGPTHVLQIYSPENNFDGIFIIDNTILGPACGCIGMSTYATPYDSFRTARKMTLSSALLEVGFGGACVNVRKDPLGTDKAAIMRSLSKSLAPYIPEKFIAAPGVNVGQYEMSAMFEEIGDRMGVTGKPENMGGIPHELGVAGFGMAVAIESFLEEMDGHGGLPSRITDARVAIQGFGEIGHPLAKYLHRKGAKVVALSDDWGAIRSPDGIDIEAVGDLYGAKDEKGSLARCKVFERMPREDLILADCDFLVPTTAHDILTEHTIGSLRTKCVVEGRNEPLSPTAAGGLNDRGIVVLPDILTLGGVVIGSYSEYCGKSTDFAFSSIESKVREATKRILGQARESGITPARTAKELAREMILQRMEGVGG